MRNKFRAVLIKRESGENPERSRHCNSWSEAECHWGNPLGRRRGQECLSQETCLFSVKGSCGGREIFILYDSLFCLKAGNRAFFVWKRGSDLVREHQIFFWLCNKQQREEEKMKPRKYLVFGMAAISAFFLLSGCSRSDNSKTAE